MKSIFSGLTSLPLIFLFFLLWNSRVVKWLFLFFFKWDARVYSSRVLKSMWQNNCDERLVLLIVFWRKVLFYYSSIWRTVQRVLLYHNFTKNLNIRAANVNIFNFYIVRGRFWLFGNFSCLKTARTLGFFIVIFEGDFDEEKLNSDSFHEYRRSLRTKTKLLSQEDQLWTQQPKCVIMQVFRIRFRYKLINSSFKIKQNVISVYCTTSVGLFLAVKDFLLFIWLIWSRASSVSSLK